MFLKKSYDFYPKPKLPLKSYLAIIFERTKVCKLHEDLVRSERDFVSSPSHIDKLF